MPELTIAELMHDVATTNVGQAMLNAWRKKLETECAHVEFEAQVLTGADGAPFSRGRCRRCHSLFDTRKGDQPWFTLLPASKTEQPR